LNNDGIVDFTISASYTSVTCFPTGTGQRKSVNITAQSANKVMLNMMSANDTIGSTLPFIASSGSLRSITLSFQCPASTGSWISATDHYLGLQLTVGSSIYYGWVRLDVTVPGTPDPHFTVKDYAYNTVANQSILAGQTCIPQAAVKANGPVSFCLGSSVVLSSKNSGNTLIYQWKKNNINISGATNKNYTATTAGDYKVKVTDTINNCLRTSAIKTVTVPCRELNTNIVETSEQLSVYPNPATSSVSIKFPSDEAGEIQIVNLFGQIVYSEKINTEQTNIDVSRFTSGMYVVRWSSGENNETKTFSVIK
jgi:hypothetical protein